MPYKNNPSGVYCIKTINTKLIYIGSSSKVKTRKVSHNYAIRNNDSNRTCAIILNAVNNGDTYKIELLEICSNYLEKEQYWINQFKGQSEYIVVNVFDANRVNSNVSKEFKVKMSIIRKRLWNNGIYDHLIKGSV